MNKDSGWMPYVLLTGTVSLAVACLWVWQAWVAPKNPPRSAAEYDTLCANHSCVGGFAQLEDGIYRIGSMDDPRDSSTNYTISGQRLKAIYMAGRPVAIIKPGDDPAWQAAAVGHAVQFIEKK